MGQSGYFHNVRSEIFPLLPGPIEKVLDVGCGAGKTLQQIKAERGCVWAGGVELSHDAAEQARRVLDVVFEGDIEAMELPLPPASLDAILCLDVLEHLRDPWSVVRRLHQLLKPGGCLIASIPNVRYFKVSLPLVFKGVWEYGDEGILDRTHLRFFTRATAIGLVESSGLKVDRVNATGLETGRTARRVNAITLSVMQSFFEFQYLIRAVRRD